MDKSIYAQILEYQVNNIPVRINRLQAHGKTGEVSDLIKIFNHASEELTKLNGGN